MSALFLGQIQMRTPNKRAEHITRVHGQEKRTACSEEVRRSTLELPVFLSMTRLKAFRDPKGSSSSFT